MTPIEWFVIVGAAASAVDLILGAIPDKYVPYKGAIRRVTGLIRQVVTVAKDAKK